MSQGKLNKYTGPRQTGPAISNDPELGDLGIFPGTWENSDRFKGAGWNMIALPFSSKVSDGNDPRDYRVLANQYNETLLLKTADKGVPNRGVVRTTDTNINQTIVALDYEQTINQFRSEDSPVSDLADESITKPIHHEPGLWLHILDHNDQGTNVNHDNRGENIARLGTIPHGNSVLALGKVESIDISNIDSIIPEVNPFPFLTSNEQVSLDTDPLDRYLEPYNAFVGSANSFFPPGLDLRNLHGLLAANTPKNVKRGLKFFVSTKVNSGGISNIPFVVEHSDAVEMTSTFWVFELDEKDDNGDSVFVMQYMQTVMLDFFDKFDGTGKIRWPHISLNTMVRTSKLS